MIKLYYSIEIDMMHNTIGKLPKKNDITVLTDLLAVISFFKIPDMAVSVLSFPINQNTGYSA